MRKAKAQAIKAEAALEPEVLSPNGNDGVNLVKDLATTKAAAPEPEVRSPNGRHILTLAEVKRFQDLYRRSSVRARKALVTTYLMQGTSQKRLAEVLNVREKDIEDNYREALEEISEQLESVPEGPMLLAQVVIEGYSRLLELSSKTLIDMLDKSIREEVSDHNSIRAYIRLRFELLDKVTDRMEKYGLLPVVSKSLLGHGGLRGMQPKSSDNLADFLQDFAAEAGIDLEEEKRQAIEASVVGGSADASEIEGKDLPPELTREEAEDES